MKLTRRKILTCFAGTGGVIFLTNNALAAQEPKKDKEEKDKEVTAVEDLMREHGVLRRALFVYSEMVSRLRNNPSEVPPDALHKTAKLFRTFGEDYHERKLEETHIFPVVKKAAGAPAGLIDVLIEQHNRGRDATDYILDLTKAAKFSPENAAVLVNALTVFVRMYRPHAAREDTVVFPAWKQILTAEQLDEMNDKFEDIEHEMFGEDGFDKTVRQISEIEAELGLADLTQFTAPILRR